jgi:hypothetical protein
LECGGLPPLFLASTCRCQLLASRDIDKSMPRKSGGKSPHSKNVDIFDDYDLLNTKVELLSLIFPIISLFLPLNNQE